MIVKTLIQKTNQSDKKVKDLITYLKISEPTYYNWKWNKTFPTSKQIEMWAEFLNVKININ